MITVDEFRALPAGTIFYVAAPGNLGIESNTLSEERFVKVIDSPNGIHLQLTGGGISYKYGKQGKSFFLDKDEAIAFMEERHLVRYNNNVMYHATQIEKLKVELEKLQADGPGEPNYKFYARGDL